MPCPTNDACLIRGHRNPAPVPRDHPSTTRALSMVEVQHQHNGEALAKCGNAGFGVREYERAQDSSANVQMSAPCKTQSDFKSLSVIRHSGCGALVAAPAAHGETQSRMAGRSAKFTMEDPNASLKQDRSEPIEHDRIRCSATLFRNASRCEKPREQGLFRTALIRVPGEE